MLFKNRILVDNIFPVLYYAYGKKTKWNLPKEPKFDDVSSENFESIWDMFAKLFSNSLARLRRQGLYREYLERTEDLPTIRGKIDMVGTIRNRIAHRQLISCEYDELSENTLNNQILKTTAMLLLREKSVKKERKDTLRREMRYFSRVDEIDPTTVQWSRIRYNRNNRSYRELISYCWLILKKLMLTERGKRSLKRFFDEDEMAAIYEKFILGYYEEEFQEKRKKLKVSASRVDWALGEGDLYEKLPKMQSDITLSYPDADDPSKVLIIDAKWYKKILQSKKTVQANDDEHVDADENANEGKIRSAHLYQIFTYVKNKEKKTNSKVSGMLLYARTNNMKTANRIGEYTICGNKIYVQTLDLGMPFDDKSGNSVKAQLDKIANDFFFPKITVFRYSFSEGVLSEEEPLHGRVFDSFGQEVFSDEKQ